MLGVAGESGSAAYRIHLRSSIAVDPHPQQGNTVDIDFLGSSGFKTATDTANKHTLRSLEAF